MEMMELRNDPSVDVDRIDAHLRIKELQEQIDNMKVCLSGYDDLYLFRPMVF